MPGREPEISDEEILDAIRSVIDTTEAPVVSTTEIGDVIGYSQPGTLKRLQKLADQGKIGRKQIGESWAWWIPNGRNDDTDDIDR